VGNWTPGLKADFRGAGTPWLRHFPPGTFSKLRAPGTRTQAESAGSPRREFSNLQASGPVPKFSGSKTRAPRRRKLSLGRQSLDFQVVGSPGSGIFLPELGPTVTFSKVGPRAPGCGSPGELFREAETEPWPPCLEKTCNGY